MPLDPSIAMGFRLPQADQPFQTASQMLTLRNLYAKTQQEEMDRQRELAFRNEIGQLPDNERTNENIAKIAQKYAPANTLYHDVQGSLDRQSRDRNTSQMALARLTEAHRINDIRIADAASKTNDREVRQQLLAAKNANDAWFQRARIAATNINTQYNTGQMPDVGAPPDVSGLLMGLQQRQQAPQQMVPQPQGVPQGIPQGGAQPTVFPPGTSMQQGEAAALAMHNAGLPVSATFAQEPPMQAQGVQSTPALVSPIPTPVPAPAPMPDAGNLDARDLQARAAQPVVAPVPTPEPTTQPPGQGVPGVRAKTSIDLTNQKIPPEIQAQIDATPSPRKKDQIRAQWTAGLVKAEIEKLQLEQSGLNAEGLGVQAWKKLMFDTDMRGMGKLNSQQRVAITNEAARIGTAMGLSPDEQAMLPQDNKVKMKAVGNLTNWGANVARAAEKLDLDLKVAIDYAKKLPLTTIQMVNKGILTGMTEFNNPDANAYASALNSVRLEYSRLMAGPTSNAMLPVEAMKRGNEMLSRGVDVPSLEEVGRQMRRDAENTKTATKNQIEALRGTMNPIARRQTETQQAPSIDDLLKKY